MQYYTLHKLRPVDRWFVTAIVWVIRHNEKNKEQERSRVQVVLPVAGYTVICSCVYSGILVDVIGDQMKSIDF